MSLTSDLEGRFSSWSDLDDDWRRGRRPAPGKMATTQRLAGSRRAETEGTAELRAGEAVQAKGKMDGKAADDPFAVHLIAQRGVEGGGGALPHLEQIQRSFGHHDVSGVRAHVGGAAAQASREIGAKAYASGDAVAFADAPDLHLAAHEAAHVVQQRGGVRLAGGVGREGDSYEQHADAVADLVVRGESAQGLLDGMAHRGAGGGAAVQGAAVQMRTRFLTDPVPADGPATEETHRGELASATLEQLFTAYAMEAPTDASAPVTIGGATVTYEWIRSRVGTVVLRGEIRSKLWHGRQAAAAPFAEVASRRDVGEADDRPRRLRSVPLADGSEATAETGDRSAICDGHEATLAAISGDATRIAELRALVAELRQDRPTLLDESDSIATFHDRTPRSRSRSALTGHLHGASDIDAHAGTGVYAPLGGTVIFSGGHPGYGNLVRLLHPAQTRAGLPSVQVESAYAHLCERLVRVGEEVTTGQAIGMIGASRGDESRDAEGRASAGGSAPGMGSHLHLAVIPRRDAVLADDLAEGPERHSTTREERRAIPPDEWLAALGVRVTSAPILAMSEAEAAAAQIAATAGGGTLDRGSVELPDEESAAPVDRFADDSGGEKGVPAGVAAPDAATERHAEAVADAVVRGESAAALLDGGPAASTSEVHLGEGDDEAAAAPSAADPAALPEGVTPAQVRTAIRYNDGRHLRIDWVRRLQAHVRTDGAMTSTTGEFDEETVAGLMRLQAAESRTVDGRITPSMRGFLEEHFADLRSTLLGSHTDDATDSHRVLVPGGAAVAERYAYYRSIITEAAGVFLEGPRQINLLGIRGVELSGTTPSLEVRQSGSAAEYAAARAEDDAVLADGSSRGDDLHADDRAPPRHFSARRPDGHEDGAGFDDLVVSLWFELVDEAPVYHVSERRGSVDPASDWTSSSDNHSDDCELDDPHGEEDCEHADLPPEGTSHLRDGQYRYRLGMHGTSVRDHREAIEESYERTDDPVAISISERRGFTYSALLPEPGLEVWRDGYGARDDDHYLTAEEEEESNERIIANSSRYTSSAIAIDIHSSPESGPSSVGCQTVPPSEGYGALIGEVRGSSNSANVYYTLIDASRIEAGLVLERSEPRSGGSASDTAPHVPVEESTAP